MYTIAGLASRTDLPRRAIQFWADKEVIRPLQTEEDTPRLYSKRELQICRLLRSLWNVGASVKFLKSFSGLMRVTLDGLEQQREGDIEVVDAALSGDPAWLIVAFQEFSEEGAGINLSFVRYRGDASWPWVYAFTSDPAEIGRIAAEITTQKPHKHVAVFNLTDALFIKPKYVARMEGETGADSQ